MNTLQIKLTNEEKMLVNVPFANGEYVQVLLNSGYEGQKNTYVKKIHNTITRGALLPNGEKVTLVDTFHTGTQGISWQQKIYSDGQPWTLPLKQQVEVLDFVDTKFFTTLGGTDDIELGEEGSEIATDASAENVWRKVYGWSDPLKPQPLKEDIYYYGAPYFVDEDQKIGLQPTNPKVFTMPFYTLFSGNKGLSVIQSLDDTILDATLETYPNNSATYTRIYHRFGKENQCLTFNTVLYAHGNDWRYPFKYLFDTYPKYFLPNVSAADEVVGCCSYSSFEWNKDSNMEDYKKRGYRVNWKASFDFPYLGMYMPLIDDVKETWLNYYKEENTLTRMREDAIYARKNDCYLLNYFNISEFGQSVQYPYPEVTTTKENRWSNCNDMLSQELADSVLFSPCDNDKDEQAGTFSVKMGQPYYSWYDCVALDCGETSYKNYLIDQAKRHMQYIPEGSGLAIDRGDWIRLYNYNADDGVSMIGDKKCRSLCQSWHLLMNDLAEVVHNENKVIYMNNHVKRLDLLSQTDGLFDEFGANDISINLTSLLATQSPAMGWLPENHSLSESNPNGFMQRYLYLGMHPMIPFPKNDHAQQENSTLSKYYEDYGQMFELMRGRKWVLDPECIQCDNAKVNLFTVKDNFFIPIVLSTDNEATVQIKGQHLQGRTAYALYPAGEKVALGTVTEMNDTCTIQVPLQRGCAVVIVE